MIEQLVALRDEAEAERQVASGVCVRVRVPARLLALEM